MASEPDASEISAVLERMVRNRDLTLFLPFIFGLSNAASRREGEDSGQENENEESPQRERIILINPFTQGMVVIDGASSLEALLRDLGSGKGVGSWWGSERDALYEMPFDEETGKKRDEEDGEERRRRIGREVWVSFSFNGEGRRNENSNQAPSDDSNDS
ncbi:hypothetical protein K1719_002672 [Acacia pycnantha]|nr:hypothetical protein K1719_002672 [Acacia pycnantha]